MTLPLHHDSFRVDRHRILDAMKDFDRYYREKEPDSGTKFSVTHSGRTYPPKRILGLAIGRPTSDFSGGQFANRVFRELGFHVGRARPRRVQSRAEVDGAVPTVRNVLSRLFSSKWSKLNQDALGRTAEFPGVYVIAYSGEDLQGSRVNENDVIYVGMSNHAGLRNRLAQFMQGLEDGGHHSAAKRFFRKWAHRTPYRRLKPRKDFFFACAAIPCVTTRGERKPRDLKKMGIVAATELYALARIRQKTRHEPELNEQ